MIIARICLPGGKLLFHGSVEIEGSPAEDDYRQKGWFPIEQFTFGFDSADAAKETSETANPASGKTNSARPANAPAKNSSEKDSSSSSSEMQISKGVDRATCELMLLAMRERSKKKGLERGEDLYKNLHADIHVLGSVFFKDNSERNIFPSMMIHLEGVHVTKWSITGSGDNRPDESITVRYDRAAMFYVWTEDAKEFKFFGPKGWDQKNHELWTVPDVENVFHKYRPQFGQHH